MELIVFVGASLITIIILLWMLLDYGNKIRVLRKNLKDTQKRFEAKIREYNTLALQYDVLKNALENSNDISNAKH